MAARSERDSLSTLGDGVSFLTTGSVRAELSRLEREGAGLRGDLAASSRAFDSTARGSRVGPPVRASRPRPTPAASGGWRGSVTFGGSPGRLASGSSARHRLAVKVAERERLNDLLEVARILRRAQRVDLCFMVDCTGSMAGHIATVKDNIQSTVDTLKKQFDALSARLAFVGYRDHCDGDTRFSVLPFTNSVDDFTSFLTTVQATGGGDAAEDVLGGFKQLKSLKWEHPTRLVCHVADAPPHGLEWHPASMTSDHHPSGHPEDPDMQSDIIPTLRRDNILYYFFKINESTNQMVTHLGELGLNVVKVHDASKLSTMMSSVAHSVSDSVSVVGALASMSSAVRRTTFTPSLGRTPEARAGAAAGTTSGLSGVHRRHRDRGDGSGAAAAAASSSATVGAVAPAGSSRASGAPAPPQPPLVVKTFALVNRVPDWTALPPLEAKIHKSTIVKSESVLKDRSKTVLVDGTVKIAAEPFGEGSFRIAYYGQVSSSSLTGAEAGASPTVTNVVLKEFKHEGALMQSWDRYLNFLEIHSLAEFFATEFNRRCSEAESPGAAPVGDHIAFLPLRVARVPGEAGRSRFLHVEPLLEGEYVKWQNNAGWVNHDRTDEYITAFGHFTFDYSNQYMLVADLQGVQDASGRRRLTDPVIHCTESTRFAASGNLAVMGMRKYFKSHVCSSVCRELGLSEDPRSFFKSKT